MERRHVTWAAWAAGVSLFAAADTALGTGAVMALAELCLTDRAYDAVLPTTAIPGMPMEHSGHVMPWLISGTLLGSVAGFGGWTIAQREGRAAWAPRRRPILAGLALVATATGTVSARKFAEAWNASIDPAITEDDAKIALARFAEMSPSPRSDLMQSLTDKRDRATFICIAVRLLRDNGDPQNTGLEMLEDLAADMGMSGLEIFDLWEAAEAPNKAAIAIGEARALGALATHAVFEKTLAVTARLAPPLQAAHRTIAPALARASRTALWAFIRAFSSPRPVRADDQLAGLRRRFRRRSLGSRLPNIAMPNRMATRREYS